MASKDTKEKILETALLLFNRDGFVNVRLQHICDVSIISLGNITYHFKTKDDIIFALWKKIESEQKILMAEFKTLPLFEDIDRYIIAQFELQQKYVFFYTDTLEIIRSYPVIGEAHRLHTQWQAQQITFMFSFNEARGVFLKVDEIHYHYLAKTWLWLSENWVNRQLILGADPNHYEEYKEALWFQLKSSMTQLGKNELQQIYQLSKLIEHE